MERIAQLLDIDRFDRKLEHLLLGSTEHGPGRSHDVVVAARIADELARYTHFFSFGSNDLTQTTYGISRDDAETGFLIYGFGGCQRIGAGRGLLGRGTADPAGPHEGQEEKTDDQQPHDRIAMQARRPLSGSNRHPLNQHT